MDEAQVRQRAQAHVDAVVRGDNRTAAADFGESARPQLGALGRAMPRPVKSARIDSVQTEADRAVVHITYVGDDETVTVRSEWAGEPELQIVSAAVVS
jgi:hypothetical protein